MNRHVGVMKLTASDYGASKRYDRELIQVATAAAVSRGLRSYFLSMRNPIVECCEWYISGAPDMRAEAIMHADRLLSAAYDIMREVNEPCQ